MKTYLIKSSILELVLLNRSDNTLTSLMLTTVDYLERPLSQTETARTHGSSAYSYRIRNESSKPTRMHSCSNGSSADKLASRQNDVKEYPVQRAGSWAAMTP